jgi:hypothetical protein
VARGDDSEQNGALVDLLRQELADERQDRLVAEAALETQLAAYEALLAGAFPRVPRIPNLDE